ncbi:hypothetical protein Hanom_Chr11g00968551 [Helianthus anomalus]
MMVTGVSDDGDEGGSGAAVCGGGRQWKPMAPVSRTGTGDDEVIGVVRGAQFGSGYGWFDLFLDSDLD